MPGQALEDFDNFTFSITFGGDHDCCDSDNDISIHDNDSSNSFLFNNICDIDIIWVEIENSNIPSRLQSYGNKLNFNDGGNSYIKWHVILPI